MLTHVTRDAALLPGLAEVVGSAEEVQYEQALRDAPLGDQLGGPFGLIIAAVRLRAYRKGLKPRFGS